MSDPVLSQLVSVEADLAQQAESLETQLSKIQARREGLMTVIDMFQAGEEGDATSPSASVSPATEEKTTRRGAGRPPGSKATQKTASKTKKKPGRKAKATTGTTRKKKDGRAADWQKYVQPEYRDIALPEAVSSVLRSSPSEVFKIADVMSSIFIEDVPRNQFLKARNRISNILSAGARDGTWYRGRNGRYSQSENATK